MNNTKWCKKTQSANPRLEKIGVECQVLQLFSPGWMRERRKMLDSPRQLSLSHVIYIYMPMLNVVVVG